MRRLQRSPLKQASYRKPVPQRERGAGLIGRASRFHDRTQRPTVEQGSLLSALWGLVRAASSGEAAAMTQTSARRATAVLAATAAAAHQPAREDRPRPAAGGR